MSNEQVVEVVERAKPIGEREFLTKYIAGCKSGKNRKQIAEELGMKETSFRQRETQVRKFWKEKGQELPKPTDSRGTVEGRGHVTFEALQDMLRDSGFTA